MRVFAGFPFAAACWLSGLALAWDQQPDGYEVIDGPDGPDTVDAWRRDWAAWKKMELISSRYDPEDECNVYNHPETQWTQHNFVQTFLMMTDRSIYDRETQQYTADKYVDEMQQRLGPLDSVLLWPAYPNIGIDNRNQWDLLRDLPGGVEGVKQLVADFHRRGVRVIIPYNPWDIGTRDEAGLEDMVRMYNVDITTLNEVIPQLQADGFNGDTMYGVPKAFFNCSKPLVATPEGGVPTAFLSHNPMSWGYFGYAHFPPVARAKFLESRHMVQICARWSLDKTAELLTAFFNGAGYVVWENVWGIWNAMTEREDETAKRMFAILRQFHRVVSTGEWTPYYGLKGDGLFASAFALEESGQALYTVISIAQEDRTFELELTEAQAGEDVRVYDVYHGVELQKQTGTNGTAVKVALEPRAFGAVYVANSSSDLTQFLNEMQAMTAKPLATCSTTRNLLQQQLVRSNGSNTTEGMDSNDDDMVRVAGAANWWFNVSGVQIEPVSAWTPNFAQFGTGVQFPWETRPWNNHSTRLFVQDFMIDRHPVTNAQYAAFLEASSYSPKSLDRFLLHWENREGAPASWTVPAGLEQSPVVNVAHEDAEAFAAFYGKRLPHDWEWQYVATNGENYDAFPWGAELDSSKVPKVVHGKEMPTLSAVGSHEGSRSRRFLVEDLVGYVWQMTDQFCDRHTCGLLLRGGSSYHPISATHSDPNWYFPQALHAQHHNRFLMISEGYDRSPMVGFRCAKSIAPSRGFDVVA